MATTPLLGSGRARAGLLAATLLVLSACSGGSGGGGEPAAGVRSTPVADADAVAGDPALGPDAVAIVQAVRDAGTAIGEGPGIEELAGRPAVAWFWAPWCTTCRAEGPAVARAAADRADEVVVFGVAGRGGIPDMERFVDDTGTGAMAHVADVNGEIWSAFGVYGQPAFAFIAADGEIEVFVGSMGERAISQRIDALIAT